MTERSNSVGRRVSILGRVTAVLALASSLLIAVPPIAANAEPAPAITGTVTFESVPASGTFLIVRLYPLDGSQPIVHDQVPVSGGYSIPTVPAGSYYLSVSASGTPGWGELFLGDVAAREQSTPITVVSGTTTTAGNVTLHPSARIWGRVYVDNIWDEDADLELWLLNTTTSQYVLYSKQRTHDDGYLEFENLPAGTYILRIEPLYYGLTPYWWDRHQRQGEATPIVLAAGGSQQIYSVADVGRGWMMHRLEGDNRFETNVAISKELFPPADGPYSIPVLYIANGLNYPDALSAGPAASHLGGGLLLVTPTAIPPVILAEIDRLNPQRIVVAGGIPSVSEAVFDQLSDIAPTDRKDGANRYETSRKLIDDAFGCDVGVCSEAIFVSTGANFPDALSSGPAAATLDAPVLLVNGGGTSLDAPTRQLIDDLGASEAYILGNEVSVTSGVENSLEALSLDVTRFAGTNRYDTAIQLNAAFFTRSESFYAASGAGFADALSGGPLAAANGAPLYLSPPTCGPIGVYDALIELDVVDIYMLGSTLSLGDDTVTSGDCGF